MAKKLDVNIDAGNFLEAFRPDCPRPATRRTVARKPATVRRQNPHGNPAEKNGHVP